MDKSETPDAKTPDAARLNAPIFEGLMGARRARLPGLWCGYEFEGREYPCFPKDESFDDEPSWAACYGGPDFTADLNWCYRAEAVVRERGLDPEYMAALLARVAPGWDRLKTDDQVVRFWFALAHASPADRASALAEVATVGPAGDISKLHQP